MGGYLKFAGVKMPVGRGLVGAGVLSAVVLVCGGCSPGGRALAGGLEPAASTVGSTASSEGGAGAGARPPDPLAGSEAVPVRRVGGPVAATVSAPPAVFGKPLAYSDGLTARVVSITQGAESGQGRGVFPGAPTTSFVLSLVNDSAADVNLGQVVVSARYGQPARVASPIYGPAAQDFGGVVKPHATVKGTYLFSIPTSQLGDVVLSVDLDGVHALGTFTGAAR